MIFMLSPFSPKFSVKTKLCAGQKDVIYSNQAMKIKIKHPPVFIFVEVMNSLCFILIDQNAAISLFHNYFFLFF